FTEASELWRRPSSPARTSGYPRQGRETLAWPTNPSEPCVCTRAHVSLGANRNGSTSERPAALRRWTTNTRTSPRAIGMVEEGIERMSADPTQEHDCLP